MIHYIHRNKGKTPMFDEDFDTLDTAQLASDAHEAQDIYNEALDECIQHGLDPRAVFPAALTTVLLALLQNAKCDEDAIMVANQCMANAMLLNDAEHATYH